MPKLTIDGREIEAAEGASIIVAARDHGIHIPHFCWHPGLSVAANCRMCLVEIEKQAKLQPACQIPTAEGMVVRTDSPRVREAQRAVMEYLLLNHPVDCPICDQAGECKLQDYYMDHDLRSSRLWAEDQKVRKPKRKVFGQHVIYDGERCVMCTRCVRFCDEVVGDPVLIEVQRSDRSEIDLAPGRSLDHAYSLMTAHVCPVGALTSRDFRFRKRVWFLSASPTICPGCATGCHAFLDHERGAGYRLRPRECPEINRTWLCDDGVLAYRWHDDRRILAPRVGRGDDGKETGWPEALAAAAERLAGVEKRALGVVLSAEHTCEENHALVAFAREALGVDRFFLAARPGGEGDDILRSADRNPNRAGVTKVLGREPESAATLADAATAGAIRGLLALGSEFELPEAEAEAALLRMEALVAIAPRVGPLPAAAHVRLPSVSWAETEGTFVNRDGRAQRFAAALAPRGEALPPADILVRLARRMDRPVPFAGAAEAAAAARAGLGGAA
jgi:NADH-quinone oxidoreductase subunit G